MSKWYRLITSNIGLGLSSHQRQWHWRTIASGYEMSALIIVLPTKFSQKIFGWIFQVRFAKGRVFKVCFSLRTSFPLRPNLSYLDNPFYTLCGTPLICDLSVSSRRAISNFVFEIQESTLQLTSTVICHCFAPTLALFVVFLPSVWKEFINSCIEL